MDWAFSVKIVSVTEFKLISKIFLSHLIVGNVAQWVLVVFTWANENVIELDCQVEMSMFV